MTNIYIHFNIRAEYIHFKCQFIQTLLLKVVIACYLHLYIDLLYIEQESNDGQRKHLRRN